ncbi:MAG: NAD-dependent epimerase/dehydratase family protein [Proteobacteria bacterium]|nr:NAD-dependent epimerase/dehydratase family protein [Pseudomonadota bacterium]
MKKVLVTGATGFIGGRIVERCLEQGLEVRAFHLPGDPGAPALEKKGIQTVAGDICDPEAVAQATHGVDVIFHCAAVVSDWAPKSLFENVTVGGTKNVCRAAVEAGVSRLVYLSTNDVFGLDESGVIAEDHPRQPWGEPYPDHKIRAEDAVWEAHREQGLPTTMAYPCWVYGPGDKTFVPHLADAIANREMVFWRRDVLVWPTYVDNLVDILFLMAEDDRAVGRGYLVHDGESTTLQEFCGAIAREIEAKPPSLHIPFGLAMAAARVMELAWKVLGIKNRPLLTTYVVKNLGSRLRFSIEKAERELGWKPAVSYREGFARTMEWLGTQDLSIIKGK